MIVKINKKGIGDIMIDYIHDKITNPFLSMYICPNCHKRHKMATKVCSYECLKEYQEKRKKENKK